MPLIWYCPSCSCSTPSNSLPLAKQIIHPVNNNNDNNAEKGDNENDISIEATMKPTNQQSNASPDTPTTCNEYPSSTSSTTKNIPSHNINNNNQAVSAAAASNNRNKINQELSFTGDKNGDVEQNSQSQQQSEMDLVNSSKAPPQQQQQQQQQQQEQQQPTEKTLNAPQKKGGLTYKESASGRLRPTCRIPECNEKGFCERHANGGTHNTSKENTVAKKEVRVKSAFRTVTVPDGVVSGDMFHVLLGKGKVMGVICPTGVFSGDKLIVINPGVQRPPIAAKKIAKMNEQYFTQGIEASLEPSYVASTFWRAVWPALSLAGWTYKRQVHYNFGATLVSLPEAQYADRSNQLLGVHYFDNIRDIRNYMLGNSEYESTARAFNADIAKKTKEVEQQAELKKKKRVTNNDAWKNVGEREHISIGSCYQVRSLPKAGSHVDGEGHVCSLNYVSESKQEQIWNTEEDAATAPILTPSTWYDTAKEPGFLDQFHKAIMKSKKQMRDLAKAINKTVGFCLWYYYTSYKPNKEMYGELKKLIKELKSHGNADECTICDEGGDLLCCETCPNSVSDVLCVMSCWLHVYTTIRSNE